MATFGGGLGRFRENITIVENPCREIVEVPGGNEWRIRRLADIFPDFSWKYPGCSVIVNYHFNRLQNSIFKENDDQKLFYAQVSHFVSPVEVSLQPKYLISARKRITAQMNAFYNHEIVSEKLELAKEQIFPSVACAVFESGGWHRAKVIQVSGREHIVVELVDIGTQVLVSRDNLRPLLNRFGRSPPLCLKCRVEGVSINDLETKDLLEFKTIVENCNGLFRVELKSVEEPFLINLFHPTITEKNVCERFFPLQEDEGKMNRLERNWIAHVKKVNEEFDEDEDDYWNHQWAGDIGTSDHEKNREQTFVRRLAKCQRAPRFENDELIVVHVENSQLIYLQYLWQVEMRDRIEDTLRANFDTYPNIPENFELIDLTCAARIDSKVIVRCIVEFVTSTTIGLILIDYGYHMESEISDFELRLLPNEELVAEEPMITIVSLAGSASLPTPHHSETVILRELIPRGTEVRFKWDKKSKNTPLRGLIVRNRYEDVTQLMNKTLRETHQNTKCSEIDVIRPKYGLSSNSMLLDHAYRPTCHPHYSKGVIEVFKF